MRLVPATSRAKAGCNGTTDNLLIDRTVTLDCHRHQRNLSVAWVDVCKAYDSVNFGWHNNILLVHRCPVWICEVVRKLWAAWNTRIVANTKVGNKTSPVFTFKRGLPQGDVLMSALVYVLFEPSSVEVAFHQRLLFIDDLKVFAAFQAKPDRAFKVTKGSMEDIGLQWNPMKCSVLNVRGGVPVDVP